jgi:ADP-heptose:LPS heptosyltransferase
VKEETETMQPVRVLVRMGGLGDVAMALCAARAVRATTGARVALVTEPDKRDFAAACPAVARVLCSPAELADFRRSEGDAVEIHQLGAPQFGFAPEHQVDAYLRALGIVAPAELKALELNVDAAAARECDALVATLPAHPDGKLRILLHPASSDPNRTWPAASWQDLARELIARGHQVLRIGHGGAALERGVQELAQPGLIDVANALSVLASVALMRQSDLLISSDSGPVQLAGATDIAIVGIYSVVRGSHRLPFRHGAPMWRAAAVEPACPAFPCYEKMRDPRVMAPYIEAIRARRIDARRMLAEWCPEHVSFRCLREEIDVPRVLAACARLLRDV